VILEDIETEREEEGKCEMRNEKCGNAEMRIAESEMRN
jgi:hypothetical protein